VGEQEDGGGDENGNNQGFRGVHAIAWRFGLEGLIKTKLFNYICKKSMGKAFYIL
jgi:hypothetical protein